eukprot:m.52398 g.52398  ORF g.52398 m.52398 type:complete len:568 (+) comp12698_c0_seq2:166-1869(+)
MSRHRRSAPVPTFEEDKIGRTECICGQPWKQDQLMLQCRRCKRWHHLACLKIDFGPYLLGAMDYTYECAQCSPENELIFERVKPTFRAVVFTTLYNLHLQNKSERVFFSVTKDVIPFIEQHLDDLMPARSDAERQAWQQKCKQAASKDHPYLERRGSDEVLLTVWQQPSMLSPLALEAKPKRQAGEPLKPSKKSKDEVQDPATVTVPFTKEGWRYEYARHMPPNADGVQSFQIVRWHSSPQISSGDRAEQLALARGNSTMTGYKGYSMARATQGVFCGNWYFEVELKCDDKDFDKLPANRQPHWRIGWAQRHGALQAPCGFDCFSYSWRDLDGRKFHNSRGTPYSKEGYKVGDVLGFAIYLPQRVTSRILPIQTRGTHVPVVVHGQNFIAEKLKKPNTPKLLEPIEGSKIVCYKNGECQGVMFENINSGTYFPAISLYNHAKVTMNFGPRFKFPPSDASLRPIFEANFHTHAALALSESLARVLNATDILDQKRDIQEFLKQQNEENNVAAVSKIPKPPPYHPSMAKSIREKYRKFLLDQSVCVEEETCDSFPQRLKPTIIHSQESV